MPKLSTCQVDMNTDSLTSPNAADWSKFKATHPEDFPFAQPRPTAVIHRQESIDNFRTPLQSPPTGDAGRYGADGLRNSLFPDSSSISPDQAGDILKQAEDQLRNGKLTTEQHSQLVRQLTELHKLQKLKQQLRDDTMKISDVQVTPAGLKDTSGNPLESPKKIGVFQGRDAEFMRDKSPHDHEVRRLSFPDESKHPDRLQFQPRGILKNRGPSLPMPEQDIDERVGLLPALVGLLPTQRQDPLDNKSKSETDVLPNDDGLYDRKMDDHMMPRSDSRMPDSRMPDSRMPDSRMPDSRMPDSSMSDSRMPDSRMPDSRMLDSMMPDSRMLDSRMPDSRMPDSRKPDSRMPDSRMSDSRMPDSMMPDSRMLDSRMPDSRMPDSRMPDSRMPDSRMPDSRMPDSRMPDSRMPDSRMSDSRMSESRMPDSRMSDSRMQDSRFADSQMQDSGINSMKEEPSQHHPRVSVMNAPQDRGVVKTSMASCGPAPVQSLLSLAIVKPPNLRTQIRLDDNDEEMLPISSPPASMAGGPFKHEGAESRNSQMPDPMREGLPNRKQFLGEMPDRMMGPPEPPISLMPDSRDTPMTQQQQEADDVNRRLTRIAAGDRPDPSQPPIMSMLGGPRQQQQMQGQRPQMPGQQPQMQGQRPQMQGQRSQMQGQRPQMQGQRPQMQGQRSQMQGPQPVLPMFRPNDNRRNMLRMQGPRAIRRMSGPVDDSLVGINEVHDAEHTFEPLAYPWYDTDLLYCPHHDARWLKRVTCARDRGLYLNINKSRIELPAHNHPREIYNMGCKLLIKYDAEQRKLYVNGQAFYNVGESAKTYYYEQKSFVISILGPSHSIWLDSVQYQLNVDAPSEPIKLGENNYQFQIDSVRNMVIADGHDICPAGGAPQKIQLNYIIHEIRFDPPPRQILLDSKLCDLDLKAKIPFLVVTNKPHGLRFDGPPRQILIDTVPYLVPLDKPRRARVLGPKPRLLAFGGPGHEVIIDDEWYEVKFGDPPKQIKVGARTCKIELRGSPPEVKIMGEYVPLEKINERAGFPPGLDHCRQQMLGPNGQPLVGNLPTQQLGPTGRPALGPDGRPLSGTPPMPQQMGPDGRPISNSPPVGPDGKPLQMLHGPDGRTLNQPFQIGPDGRQQMPLGPDVGAQMPMGPNRQPQMPMGPNRQPQMHMGPNRQPQMPMGPNGQPQMTMGPNGQPQMTMGPNGQPQMPMGPNGQPHMPMGPNGQPHMPMGPNGQPQMPIVPQGQIPLGPDGRPHMQNNMPFQNPMGPQGPLGPNTQYPADGGPTQQKPMNILQPFQQPGGPQLQAINQQPQPAGEYNIICNSNCNYKMYHYSLLALLVTSHLSRLQIISCFLPTMPNKFCMCINMLSCTYL